MTFSTNSYSNDTILKSASLNTMLLQILTLLGGRTVTQVKLHDSGEIRNKTSVSGVLIALFYCGFSFYSDYVTEEIAEQNEDAFHESNNILRGILALGRAISLIQQPLLAITSYIQSKNHLLFLTQLREMDEYLLDGGVKVDLLVRRVRLVEKISCGVVFLITVLSALILILLFYSYYEFEPTFFDVYISLLPLINYLVHVLVTCVYLYAVTLRMKSHNAVLKQLFVRCHQLQMENVSWEVLKRKYMVQ